MKHAMVCIMAFLMLTGLSGCGGGEGNTAGRTVGYYTAGQNGAMTSPWSDGLSIQTPAVAVKFTPPSYPFTISSVTIYAVNNTGSDQMFDLYATQHLPSPTDLVIPVLFHPMENQVIPGNGTAVIKRTVSIPVTTVNSGDFYVVVRWVTRPLTSVSGANSFFICSDSTLDYLNSSYINFGTGWQNLETAAPADGDLGIVVN